MKRLMTLFAAVVFVGQARAQTSFEVGNLKYTITNETNHYVSVGKAETEPTGALNIPEKVTNPDNSAEYTVTSIGRSAFEGCSGLTSVTIGNSVTSIGYAAFYGCSGLTSVTIPNSVTSIGDWAFADCSSLASVTIPNSVTSIGGGAFRGCNNLTSVTIPNFVTSIGGSVFRGCNNLKSVTIPNSVTSVGDNAFRECSSLASVTIPNSVTSIGDFAFEQCSSLASVTIPNSVTSIGDNAFENCISLASVTIGNSVASIGISVFSDCISLASIVIAEENTKYDSRNNCNAVIETETNTLVFGCKNTKIPNTITTIGWFAFYHCKDLTSVTIPNSVTYIGGSAFVDCSSLTSVTIPSSVTYIGNQAFAFCTNATIYCEEEGEPDEWDWAWNDDGVKVVWGSEMPTAVTETAATAVNIYAYGRSIVVENATDEISVYNVMGTLVYRDVARNVSTVAESGIRAELQVNGTGVYIVRVGNIAKRVVIN